MNRTTRAEASIEIDAPPDTVWSITSDPRNLPHWDRHIEAAHVARETLGPGAAYEVRMRFMAVTARVQVEVEEWEPPWRAVLQLRSTLLQATVTTIVASLPVDRSLLRHQVRYRFRGPLGLFGARSLNAVGGAQLALRRGLTAQKREIESR
ncbi:MAG: SRPBCC family protein [Actinomycetota bacterium]